MQRICGSIKPLKLIFNRNYSDLNHHYDIIIAGGGMIGTTLAAALGNHYLYIFLMNYINFNTLLFFKRNYI